MDNLQTILDLLRQFLDVLSVLRRQQHRLDARPQGPDQLLLDAADGGYPSPERNLALLHTRDRVSPTSPRCIPKEAKRT